jgi:hypothetical protein
MSSKCSLLEEIMLRCCRGHLYRHHRIFQCPRCKILHKNSDELERHILAVNACEVIHQQPIEGITWSIERKLKGRKRQHQEETEVERWQEIYETLFPEEIVPLPCKCNSLFTLSYSNVDFTVNHEKYGSSST